MSLSVTITAQSWPLASAFVIARGSKTQADVVVVELTDGTIIGRGECVPYARYGETCASVMAQLHDASPLIAQTPLDTTRAGRIALQTALPAGAARNALDCAFWDFEAKRSGVSVAALTGCGSLKPLLTAYTLSLDRPEAMADAARRVPHLPLLKLKLGGSGDDARLRAIRAARPDARLIADANEAWSDDQLMPFLAVAIAMGVELIEQPLPTGRDEALLHRPPGIVICADESLHTRADLGQLAARYDAINVKLDKAGGLTEALALAREARAHQLGLMVGCMVGTSLAMAPALIVGQDADWVDLDGPLLLAVDRKPGLTVTNGVILPAAPELWG